MDIFACECQKSRRSGRSHFFLKHYGRHKRAQCCVFEGGLAAHFSSVRAITSLRLAAKQCPHLIKVHRDVTFTFKFTSCRMNYATNKRGWRGKKSKQDNGKMEWLREGSWECVNIFAIFFCFVFLQTVPRGNVLFQSSYFVLYKHQLQMFLFKRN